MEISATRTQAQEHEQLSEDYYGAIQKAVHVCSMLIILVCYLKWLQFDQGWEGGPDIHNGLL